MTMRAAAFALLALGLATPAAAAGKFTPPSGCTVFATVQHRNCEVSQHYRCEGDPADQQWSVYADARGPFFASRIDGETRWLESLDLDEGLVDTLGTEADPASFSELLSAGKDSYDFTQTDSNGTSTRYVGEDRLTGQSVTIGGQTLERTEYDIKAYDGQGAFLWHRTGNDLIHRDWRLFFGDRERFENNAGDVVETTSTPVTIAVPGDKGFLATKPEFDCDMMMTRATPEAAPLATETNHDGI